MDEQFFISNGAQWIRHCDELIPDTYYLFRKDFDTVEACTGDLYLSADFDFVLYVNGTETGRGQFSDYPLKKTYTHFSVPFRKGKNQIAVYMHYRGENFSSGAAGIGAMLCLVLDPQKNVLAASSADWKAEIDPAFESGNRVRVTSQLGFVMTYHAERAADWTTADVSSWKNAVIRPESEGKVTLEERPIPAPILGERMNMTYVKKGFFRRTEELRTFALTVFRGDSYVFQDDFIPCTGPVICDTLPEPYNGMVLIADAGEEAVGYIELDITAPEGTVIDISHGEHLASGMVRAYVGERNFCDRYICKEGRNQFLFPFRRVGGRFIQANIVPSGKGAVAVHYLGLRRYDIALPPAGRFATDDPACQPLREVGIRTLNLCMHDHYEDCPWREQSLYAYDSRNQMIYGYCVWGNYPFARASLDLLGGGLHPDDGLLNICAPNAAGSLRIVLFSYVWICEMYEYYLYSGDDSLFRKYADQIRFMMEKLEEYRDPASGLYMEQHGQNVWNFIEWVDGLDGQFHTTEERAKNLSAAHNAYLAEAMDSYAAMLALSGLDKEQEERIRSRSAELKKVIHRTFFDPEKHLYRTFINGGKLHPHTQYLMLSLGIAPDNEKEKIYQADRAAKGEFSFSPLLYFMRAMAEISAESRAGAREYIDREFQRMIDQGATTFWEVDSGESAFWDAGSLCHAWSSIHTWYYGTMTLGVRPLTPGFAAFEVRIDPGKYRFASGEMPTPHGMISVDWKKQEDGSLDVTVKHPAACKPVFRAYSEAPYAGIRTETY